MSRCLLSPPAEVAIKSASWDMVSVGSVEGSGVQRRSRGPELTVKRTTVAPRRAAKLPFGATPEHRAEHRARLRPLQRLVIPPLELMLEREGLRGSPARQAGVSTRNVSK